MIKLGICTAPDNAALVREAGFDYIECGLWTLEAMSEEEYAAAREAIERSPIRAEVFNIMIPASVPVVGPKVSNIDIRRYLDRAIPRAASMGCQVIVFGSGGSRRVPENYPMDDAYDDIISYLRIAGDRCAKHGISIAIEPLNSAECNILNSVAEATWIARRSGHSSVKVLVDNYHAHKDNLSLHEVRAAGCLMAHTHVSHPNRDFPRPGDGYDYSEFFKALNDIGYKGRMSVEARYEDFEADLANAYQVLSPLRQRA